MANEKLKTSAVLLAGLCVAAALCVGWALAKPPQPASPPAAAGAAAAKPAADAELEVLKGKMPDQAHAMQDVGEHFSNLWFAGQKQNWDLAGFYWGETRSHLRWAVRIIPRGKDTAGREIDLEAILQALENAALKHLQEAIAAKDKPAFAVAYRQTLEGCYTCHKAADKPYLRPQIPQQPASTIINFDPAADWPK